MSCSLPSTSSTNNKIFFPQSYEDDWHYVQCRPVTRGGHSTHVTWGSSSGAQLFKTTNLFLRHYLINEQDAHLKQAMRAVLMGNQPYKSVEAMALAIKEDVFQNCHNSWRANALLQRIRFILLKTLPEISCRRTATELRNFFFDPSISLGLTPPTSIPLVEAVGNREKERAEFMERNPLPPQVDNAPWIHYTAPLSPLKVVIIGGGPAGLTAAIRLAELVRDGRRLQIDIYEKRWKKEVHGTFGFAFWPADQRRRDQVVTLQNHVLKLLSPECQRIMFPVEQGGPENVWPDSCNLQIQKVEDALLVRAQDGMFKEMITLHGVDIKDEESLIQHTQGDFHLMIGCDGGGSWVRNRYFHGDKEDRGTSLALGIALNTHGQPLPRSQATNIFLTLCQTRYLLNASDRDGRGYLNMVVTREEYDSAVTVGGQPCNFRTPGFISAAGNAAVTPGQLFAPYVNKSPLWQAIQDGLLLFGFREDDIDNIVRIPISLAGVSTPTKTVQLHAPGLPGRRPHCLVSLVGDSALSHHFWAGRGMNSGIKSAIAWANQVSNLILNDSGELLGLREVTLAPYETFMERLKRREHEGRSFHILNQSGSPNNMKGALKGAKTALEGDAAAADLSSRQSLVDLVLRFQQSFERRERPQWYHEQQNLSRFQIFRLMKSLTRLGRISMFYTGAWPLRAMSAEAEIVPELPISEMRHGDTLQQHVSTKTTAVQETEVDSQEVESQMRDDEADDGTPDDSVHPSLGPGMNPQDDLPEATMPPAPKTGTEIKGDGDKHAAHPAVKMPTDTEKGVEQREDRKLQTVNRPAIGKLGSLSARTAEYGLRLVKERDWSKMLRQLILLLIDAVGLVLVCSILVFSVLCGLLRSLGRMVFMVYVWCKLFS